MIFYFPRQWAPGVGAIDPLMGGVVEPEVMVGGEVALTVSIVGAVVSSDTRMGAASVEGSARIRGGVVS